MQREASANILFGLESSVEVTALLRTPDKLESWRNQVRVIKGDALDKAAIDRAVSGVF